MLFRKRFDVYSNYMKKADELMNSVRTNPNMMYGLSTEFLAKMISGNEDEINEALISLNQKLQDLVKSSSEPLLILRQELSTLLLVVVENFVL